MNILLDTHVLLWLNADDSRLTDSARRMLDQAREIFVSAVSFWELAIKVSRRAFQVDLEALTSAVHANGFTLLPVTVEHACTVAGLPWHHRDPFDRMLVAQAMREPMHLLTADRQLEAYTDLVIRV